MKTKIDLDGQPLNKLFNAERRIERDISEMLGLIKGVLADGKIDDSEIQYFKNWLLSHPDAISIWPCNILAERIEQIFKDGKISEDERIDLQQLFSDLVGGNAGIIGNTNAATMLPLDNPSPAIVYNDNVFVLTGKFAFGPRKVCQQFIQTAGGICEDAVTKRTRYLIIGTFGSLDWVHTTHGRKIEEAVQLQKAGHPISIIGEDHWTSSLTKR